MKMIIKASGIMLAMTMCITGCMATYTKNTDTSETEAIVSDGASVSSAELPELDIADNSVEFAKSLKLGWNLGNTLDATGSSQLDSEVSWGQPKVTKELIEYVKESGFTSIRIPVSWGKHTDEEYNISAEWMDRVNEIVDYAVESGLYVIINSHHDCDYYYPKKDKLDNAKSYIEKIWTQIAERFKDYDERLIFESMNEPRLMNTNKEWWFSDNDPVGIESIECIVELNQLFVDTVRASGGNNKTRFLMVPSNAASPGNALNDAFKMPEDSSDRLILSVHAYTPYEFAMNENGYKKWGESREKEIVDFMSKLDEKFVKNGYGVVIGEFGATNKDNLESRVAWADSYTRLASEYGYACFLWDNGGTKVGSENFGMINRQTLTISYPEILDAMLKNLG